jgi:hypothetical protein
VKGVRDFAFIEEIGKTPEGYVFTVQYADLLRGEEARKAAVEDGEIGAEDPWEEEFYMRPTEDDPVELRVSKSVQVFLARRPPEPPVAISVEEFVKLFEVGDPEENELAGSGWWITMDGERILKLEQQWEP